MSIRLLQLLLLLIIKEKKKKKKRVADPPLSGEREYRGGWLDKLIIYVSVRAQSPLNIRKELHPHAALYTHATKCAGTFCWSCTGGASYEVYSLHQKDTSDISDHSQMMMHRDLLPLQRQNKRTDMKEKSINIRRLIKHAFSFFFPSFSFFFAEFTTKLLTVFCLSQLHKKKKAKKCWVTWLAAILSFSITILQNLVKVL